MTPQEFIATTEKEIFSQMLRDTNELFGQSKAASLFISLFSTVRCKIVLEQCDDLEGPFKKLDLEDLTESVTTNVEGDDITYRFFYRDEKHLKHLHKVATKYPMYFTYQYFKHIYTLLTLTSTQAHQAAMFRLVQDKEHPFYLIDLANTYAINKQVHRMLSIVGQTKKWEQVKQLIQLYKNPELATQAEILADMAQNAPDLRIQKARGKYTQVITPDLTYITETKVPAEQNKNFKGADSIDKQERSLVAVSNQLHHSISTSIKGTAIGEIFQIVFDAIKVELIFVDPFQILLNTQVFNKTQNGYASWENLSATYRHIYTAPIQKSEDKKVKFIISIDTSGSMHTEDLQKIFGIMKDKSKQIAEIHVMHHTTDVVAQFHVKHAEDIQLDRMFKTAFGCRHADGGTSHKEVFNRIKELNLPDPEQWIYISVSDNYSDIESTINIYPIMQKITSVWVQTSDGRDLNSQIVKGTHVTLP